MSDNLEIDEQSLFDNAVSDEPAVDAVAPEPVADEPAEPSQPRDPAGRFASKTEPEPPAEVEPSADDRIPQWRREEIAAEKNRAVDEARAAKEEAARERAARAALEQRLAAMEKPKEPEKAPTKPDPLLDPEGYEKYLETRFEQRMLNERRETSLQNAAAKYKEEFGEAYQAAQQKMSPALRAMMHESRDPGETLIQWHRQEKARAEVGDDLGAYKQRLRDELLKDPEFRKQAMDAWRAGASPAPGNGRPAVDLPPSLSGASRSHALLKPEANPSDQELFESIAG